MNAKHSIAENVVLMTTVLNQALLKDPNFKGKGTKFFEPKVFLLKKSVTLLTEHNFFARKNNIFLKVYYKNMQSLTSHYIRQNIMFSVCKKKHFSQKINFYLKIHLGNEVFHLTPNY